MSLVAACSVDLLPRLIPMPDAFEGRACTAGMVLLPLALLALAWRGFPAVTGRVWRRRGDDPAHLPRAAQRVEDVVLPAALVLIALGLLHHDWGWQLAGFVVAVGWIGAVVAFGLRLEAGDPTVPATTKTLLSEPVEPVEPPIDDGTAGPSREDAPA